MIKMADEQLVETEDRLENLFLYNKSMEKQLKNALERVTRSNIRCPCGAGELRYPLPRQYVETNFVGTSVYATISGHVKTIPYIEEKTAKCPVCKGSFMVKQMKYPKDYY